MISRRKGVGAAVIAAAAAVLAVGYASGSAAYGAPETSSVPGGITVYQEKIVNQHVVLGPQSAPTTLISSTRLPAGTYMITATVGAVISSHDQIVCAAGVNGNDGVFGTAGNPGAGGIYGTATITDTWTVTAGQQITLGCNSFNYGKGTYAGSVVLNLVPVNHLHT